ncbi:MAG TPA: bifunctional [glutamate--ammonia ligase]-adenylyl-L-tyrosine phosphorylase/[glutamate--ammonia-ligase] adenylyltransferase [Deltaproteobacteria bacterium]|nr:bifunctional [glutamate--ammonia ligase]-adenylyl-L-tyrosine phosphorylase/[glutamate--ammonia-ligase] adenylyltransferase [Deltaproteobacteria bacterium]
MTADILHMEDGDAIAYLRAKGFSDEVKAIKDIKLLAETPFKQYIQDIINYSALSPSPSDSLNNLEKIASKAGEDVIRLLCGDNNSLRQLVFISGSSNFLSNILAKNGSGTDYLFKGKGLYIKKELEAFSAELEEAIKESKWSYGSNDHLKYIARTLRLYREREYLRIGARDILNIASMAETTLELSDLASACLDAACRFCLEKLKGDYGIPVYIDFDGTKRESEFVIIGMGKLGGRELNFSSDIDIIYVYSSDNGETTGVTPLSGVEKNGGLSGVISLHVFFVKLSEMVTKLIGQVTEDGLVFRIDLDLRPEGRSGDLANSLRSAEIYYESWGQTWERAAMLKARPVAGSLRLGEEFLKMLEPFIYRRYLDFSAIEEIKGMKEKIDFSLLRRDPDAVDVKLGFGGIREIEFFIQALQLINAGKDRSIRGQNTLRILKALEEKGYIASDDANTLIEVYLFLRDVEHRIQIVEARQTQAIPKRAKEVERLAKMLGFKNTQQKSAGELFWERYKIITERVHEIYDRLFYKPSREMEEGIQNEVFIVLSDETEWCDAIKILKGFGFNEPERTFENLKLIKHGQPFSHIPQRTRVVLGRILPFLLSRIIASPDPDMALAHLERFAAKIGGRGIFYSLLAENRKVMELLVKLFSTSAFLSRQFIEHPEIMDYLLSSEVNKTYKEREEMYKEITSIVESAEDYESKLDALRRYKNTEILRIGINDVFGGESAGMDVSTVSRQITCLAEAGLEKAYQMALDEVSRRYGMPGDKRFAVLALGKFGGEEITYSSDLDLIFVYGGAGETDGERRVSNHEFYAKLCQRIISVLAAVTREGFVFKVDTRLRPSGSSGPIVITQEAFLKYHESKAAVWERQAMIRARHAAGNIDFGNETVASLHNIIYKKGLNDEDITELLRIRKRMELEIAKETPDRYNIKTGKGGLIDIEFAVQALQMRYGKDIINVRSPNTMHGLENLAEEGIINFSDYDLLKEAYNFYRLMENRMRIVHDRTDEVIIKGSSDVSRLAKRSGFEGEDAGGKLIRQYLGYSKMVREIYTRIMGFGGGI